MSFPSNYGAHIIRMLFIMLPISIGLCALEYPIPDPSARIFTCGNSHTNSTFSTGLEALLEENGHDVSAYGTAGLPGASLHLIWNNAQDSLQNVLAPGTWDILTLQTYTGNIADEGAAAVEMVRLARNNNPDVRVLMYTIWPGYGDRNDPPMERTEAWTEAVRDVIHTEFPDTVVQVMPVSQAFLDIYRMIDAGQVPNIDSSSLLFRDGGHVGKYGAYIVNAMGAAMIYRESPVGYSNISVEGQRIEQDTALVMQELIWDILQTYDGALVNDDPTISTRRLQVAVVGLSFQQQLAAINVSGNEQWSVTGSLPTGLSLDASGLLSGTPTETGEFPLTIRLEDAGSISERDYTCVVSNDLPPRITTTDLPQFDGAKYGTFSLQSADGVGVHSWSLVAGTLPAGLTLQPSGALAGVPGQFGTFPITVQVSDAHPNGSQSVTADFDLVVDDAPAGTLLIPSYDHRVARPLVDGDFDEVYWDLDQTVPKAVEGDPTASARWGAFWMDERLYIGIDVDVGALGKTDLDAVDVFFDGNNNDEVIYNYDDMHWHFGRLEQTAADRIVSGYARFFNAGYVVKETATGYAIEMVFNKEALQGRGIVCAWPEWAAFGFDIAVIQGDAAVRHQQVWQGSVDNPTDTSPFGTILFDGEPHDHRYEPQLHNTDFAKDHIFKENRFVTNALPRHIWVAHLKHGEGSAWHITPGVGIFQNDPAVLSARALVQIIDGSQPGSYELALDYRAETTGFQVAIWGADLDESAAAADFSVDTLSPPSGAVWKDTATYLPATQVTATGDPDWHQRTFSFDVDQRREEFFLVIVPDAAGDTGIGFRSIDFSGNGAELSVQAQALSHEHMMVLWNDIPGAEWYWLIRQADGVGNSIMLRRQSALQPSRYFDRGLAASTTYQYGVIAGTD